MRNRRCFSIGVCLLSVMLGSPEFSCPAFAADPHARWEPDIQAFEASDRTNPPPANAILFVGSSSIRMWASLKEDFSEFQIVQRGYGGSQMDDTVHFVDRIVTPYRPRQIVVYAGDNDIASGKSPERVACDFEVFVRRVWEKVPGARIAYIAIKPSASRWKFIDAIREANRLIARFTASNEDLAFIDVFTPMLGDDGQPREELFLADKLHLNAKGYQLWASLVRPHLRP
ncbi:MAG: SGNH/GDSL hydrolase family protein [Verrucomicrobiia bacterium]